ncbi:DUF6476 family protein [Palleronia caenipelagi]|uniref:Uncharacterized protein n=1 Tax=Palleronia caenipelagi TaxID=2489174 RepID=A0A547Q5E2_9RHOB|nr:DUF6476 family protein [Palleronia caenipelagi]TRD21594.1 hypothetical protein FEV53_08945 [Palleronia caenipelagi]
MDDTPSRDGGLILLKWLVIALTATMLVSIVTLVWLFIDRLPRPMPELPMALDLPEDVSVQAFTQARDFIAVVTTDGEILIYDPKGQTLRQRINVQ